MLVYKRHEGIPRSQAVAALVVLAGGDGNFARYGRAFGAGGVAFVWRRARGHGATGSTGGRLAAAGDTRGIFDHQVGGA